MPHKLAYSHLAFWFSSRRSCSLTVKPVLHVPTHTTSKHGKLCSYHSLSLKPVQKYLKVQCHRWPLDTGFKKIPGFSWVPFKKPQLLSRNTISVLFFNNLLLFLLSQSLHLDLLISLLVVISKIFAPLVALMSAVWALIDSSLTCCSPRLWDSHWVYAPIMSHKTPLTKIALF